MGVGIRIWFLGTSATESVAGSGVGCHIYGWRHGGRQVLLLWKWLCTCTERRTHLEGGWVTSVNSIVVEIEILIA